MTVRIAQFGSDGLSSDDPAPEAAPGVADGLFEQGHDRPQAAEAPAVEERRESDGPDKEADEASLPDRDDAPIGEGRRALRAERQERRRLAVACAVVIAICLVVTILIVGLARNRAPGAVAPPSTVTAVTAR